NSEGRGTVPEPGSLALIGLGLAGLIERRRRKSA
ncbi:PEP-CTERM sorting domain-containing protein, partial [Zoogloea sp.]